MKRSYVTNLTRDYKLTTNGEVNTKPSLTVPDMATPISELLVRATRGEAVPVSQLSFQEEDDGDFVMPDFRHMDLADAQDYAADLAAFIAEKKAEARRKPAGGRKPAEAEGEGGKPQASDAAGQAAPGEES